MVRYALVAFAGLVAAVPLNINLGAYSPALVVGDGEISFGGKQDVSNLITALEGAAVNAAAGAANQANGAAAAASTETPGNAAAAVVSTVPAPTPTVVKSAANDPVLADQAQQIAKLQGLGKAIAPRIGEQQPAKRDIAGFDRALKYAEVALTKGPKVQLGTGAEGSGVGIIVDNNAVAGAGAGAANGQRAGAEKRDATTTAPPPRRRAKVTTMFVRRGIPASIQPAQQDALSEALEAAAAAAAAQQAPPAAAAAAQGAPAAAAAAPVPVAVSKRAENAFDAVNLNVDGDAGVTMTFVESVDEGADEES